MKISVLSVKSVCNKCYIELTLTNVKFQTPTIQGNFASAKMANTANNQNITSNFAIVNIYKV